MSDEQAPMIFGIFGGGLILLAVVAWLDDKSPKNFAKRLTQATALGVVDVYFAKRRGISVVDMVKSSCRYRKLRAFRAGIESVVSLLKRAFGLDRCTMEGRDRLRLLRATVGAHGQPIHSRATPMGLNLHQRNFITRRRNLFPRRGLDPPASAEWRARGLQKHRHATLS